MNPPAPPRAPGDRPLPPSLLDLTDLRPEALPPALHVPPIARPFHADIRPPGSKSLTNRALLLAALATGTSTLRDPLTDADDAQVMLRAIAALGAAVDQSTPGLLRITGVASRWSIPSGQSITLDLHNAGTATRFLAAAALLAPPGTSITIDGHPRMRQRPIAELTAALRTLNARIHHPLSQDCPPVTITPPTPAEIPPTTTPTVEFGTTASSQFISALLLTAPFLPAGLRLTVRGQLTSPDYIAMTLHLLRRVGVILHQSSSAGLSLDIIIPPQPVPAFDLAIEPDASGATYFQAAAALIPGSTTRLLGLPADPARSLQGDARFTAFLSALGTICTGDDFHQLITGHSPLRGLDFDLANMPDTAMTAAVLAAFASGPTTLRGLRTLRVKETDRLAALQTELTKLGHHIEILRSTQPNGEGGLLLLPDESLRITPSPAALNITTPVAFDTYDDHRMAMALALVGLRRPNVIINDPACVRKTYPTFWLHLRTLYK